VLLAAPLVVAYCIWAALHNLSPARRRAIVGYLLLAACVPLAVVATPYGFSIMDYYRSVLANPVLTGRVAEWQAATFSGPSTQFVIVLLATVATIGFAYGRGYRPQLFMVAMTCALAAAGVHAVRYQVWFAFAATILIADVMHSTFGAGDTPIVRRIASRVVPALAVAGLLGSTLLLATTPTSRFETLSPRGAMDAAAQWAAAHPSAKIMAGDVSADALLWTHPELAGRIGFDSRYEVYSQSELELYTNWVADQGVRAQWAADLNGYDEVILSKVYRGNDIKRMHLLPEWHEIYSDAEGAVFVRASAG
jgi:hypothetical protein